MIIYILFIIITTIFYYYCQYNIYIYIYYIFIQHFLGIPVRVIHSGIPTRPFVLRRSQMVVLARKLLETMCCTKNWVKAEDLRRSRDGFCWVSSWEHVVARVYSTHIDTHTHTYIYIYTYNIYIYTYIYIYIYIYIHTHGVLYPILSNAVLYRFFIANRGRSWPTDGHDSFGDGHGMPCWWLQIAAVDGWSMIKRVANPLEKKWVLLFGFNGI